MTRPPLRGILNLTVFVAAALVGRFLTWQHAYLLGGCLGLVLLGLPLWFMMGILVLSRGSSGLGLLGAAWVVGLACFALGAFCLAGLEDTHGRDLDFLEKE